MAAEEAHIGLCASCVHARRIPHPRGGEPYWMCGLSETDPEFPRYPRLPVLACRGYEPLPPEGSVPTQ